MILTLTNCIITAYIATGNLDASGHIPQPSYTISTARRDFPLGSKLKWNGEEFTVNDHMNKHYNGIDRFDIFVSSLKEAKEFGCKKNQTIVIQF